MKIGAQTSLTASCSLRNVKPCPSVAGTHVFARSPSRYRPDPADSGLRFSSKFESGNLRKVIQVREYVSKGQGSGGGELFPTRPAGTSHRELVISRDGVLGGGFHHGHRQTLQMEARCQLLNTDPQATRGLIS